MSERYEPFDNAEEVWFWFCNCLLARGEGLRANQDYSKKRRAIEVADIYRIVKKLKHQHMINNRVLRVLSKWGDLGYPPTHHYRAKPSEIRLWEYGINCLDSQLRHKGIIQ